MIYLLIWLLIFGFYCFHAWINWKNNLLGGQWFLYAWLISILPVFPLIARYSKNILLDGMIFDVIIFLSYVGTMIYLGAGEKFVNSQWFGLAITIIGFILMKVKF